MNKIFVNLIMTAALITPSSAIVTANESMPVGGFDNGEVIRFEVDFDGSQMEDGAPLIGLFDNDEYTVPETGLYSYGGDYGYRYFKNTNDDGKAEQRSDLYERLHDACIEIATSNSDFYSSEMYEQQFGNSVSFAFIDRHPEMFIPYDGLGYLEAQDVYSTFRNDHPEFYWLPSVFAYVDSSAYNMHYVMLYVSDTYNEASERAAADEVIGSTVEEWLGDVETAKPESTYEAVRLVHDLIIDEVDYGEDDNGNPLRTEYAHSIVGVFDDNEETDVVCEGYAKAFQLLLNALDIDNIYVTGLGDGGNGIWGGHAWNMVKLDDGEYYNFDVTWDDAGGDRDPRYDYFAVGEDFFENHIINTPDGTYERIPENIVPNYEPAFLYELPDVPEYDFELSTPVRTVPPVETSDPSVTDDPFEVTMECELSEDQDTGAATVEVTFDKMPESAVAYVAGYDSQGILIGVEILNITSEQMSIPVITDGVDFFKIFAWSADGGELNRPVAEENALELGADTDVAEGVVPSVSPEAL